MFSNWFRRKKTKWHLKRLRNLEIRLQFDQDKQELELSYLTKKRNDITRALAGDSQSVDETITQTELAERKKKLHQLELALLEPKILHVELTLFVTTELLYTLKKANSFFRLFNLEKDTTLDRFRSSIDRLRPDDISRVAKDIIEMYPNRSYEYLEEEARKLLKLLLGFPNRFDVDEIIDGINKIPEPHSTDHFHRGRFEATEITRAWEEIEKARLEKRKE